MTPIHPAPPFPAIPFVIIMAVSLTLILWAAWRRSENAPFMLLYWAVCLIAFAAAPGVLLDRDWAWVW